MGDIGPDRDLQIKSAGVVRPGQEEEEEEEEEEIQKIQVY
jgi:hypothetical protein